MRVVHIACHYGTDNTGGASIASTRLHRALLAAGVDSHYVCLEAREPGTNVHELPVGGWRGLHRFLSRLTRGIWKFTPIGRSLYLNLVPLFGLERLLERLRPDVLHVHWIVPDVLSYGQLARLGTSAGCRVFLHFHDLTLLTAREAHPGRDRRYVDGFTRANANGFDRWLFARKRRAVAALHPVLVAPSAWACRCCTESLVGRGLSARTVPNLVGGGFVCRPRPTNARFVILFGANGGRGSPWKGFPDLAAALALLPDGVKRTAELRIFGEDGDPCETAGVPTRFLGEVKGEDELLELYNGADVLAFPSVCETQGLVKVEAMLCGTPVVAFDRTACAEGVEDGVTGSVVPDGDVAAYAAALVRLHADWRTGELTARRDRVAAQAAGRFDDRRTLERLTALYAAESEEQTVRGVVAVVPVFNPEPGLIRLCEALLARFETVLVVDDGSREDAEAFARLPAGVAVVRHTANCGKGRAIKTAFAWIAAHRPEAKGAVFADGDGQHLPEDIVRVAVRMLRTGAVTLGVRDFAQPGTPGRSRLGNVLTSFLVRIFFRIRIFDTQTGLRAVPARLFGALERLPGERYEYEMRLFGFARESGERLEQVPIETIYLADNRTSHFRPVVDSFRIYRGLFGMTFRRFLAFLASSLLGFLTDNVAFTAVLVGLEATALPRRTAILGALAVARAVSATVNYLCNRRFVFGCGERPAVSSVRYLALVGALLALSYAGTALLASAFDARELGVTGIKIAVETVLFLASYRIQRRWVFARAR